jgi:hypothetical protein
MPKGKAKYLKNPDLARKYDFDTRKHLHVKLFTKTKNELKIVAYRMNLSLQEIFERLARAIIDEDPYIITMLNEYRLQKESGESSFSETDIDSIYDLIEKEKELQKREEEKEEDDTSNVA